MADWSLMTELIALLLILVLALNFYRDKRGVAHTVRRYGACLILSAFSICWNMLCVLLIRYSSFIPVGLNMAANTVYYLAVVSMCSVIAMYLFEKLLAHVYDQFCIRRARAFLIVLTAAFFLLAGINLWTGVLFYFDQNGNYQRGFLNWSGYGILLLELIVLLVCYFRHRSSVSRVMRHVLTTFPPVLLVLVAIQLTNQQLLLNGMIVAFVDLILYLNFQSQRMEVDGATGLGNRDSFFQELSLRIAGSQQFQVIAFSIQEFRKMNQRYGYTHGNEFLYAVAVWMEQEFPQSDAFRYIGTTFAVILPYHTPGGARENVGRMQKRFEQPWVLGTDKEYLRASFCDFIYKDPSWKEDHILLALDYMLTQIKRTRLAWLHFDEEVEQEMFRRRKIAELLQDAVQEKRFQVWYQPVYCYRRRQFCSAEALIRLRDEEENWISPQEFIPIAEEMGLTDEIFWYVMEETCALLHRNPQFCFETVSINLAIPQFEIPDLPERIEELAGRYGIPPAKLRFEITERMIAQRPEQIREKMLQMTEKGFGFYLDDFGTGYSNFASVVQFPLEYIKLDKSLIHLMQQKDQYLMMLRGLIELFHEMRIGVIAEGMETQEQAESLAALGLERMQGFYYARPMPEEELGILLRTAKVGIDKRERI